jgi:PAS domain S-box-containing protein
MPESRPRILIVDDREQNRYVLCRILRMSEYNCMEARTGAEALELAQSLPDLIILDVNLPDMSGYEVCRQIKRGERTAHISILQISASFVSAEEKARALEGGADGYLVHPIDGTVLVATVRSLLRLRAAEAVARQSAEQWQSTFDALTEGIAFINAEGRLLRWNAAFAEICGSQCDLRSGEDADIVIQSMIQTREPLRQSGPERYRGEYQIGRRSIELSVNRVKTDSVQTGTVLVLTDITDRQLAEYALRTAEKISATGKLAHAIAHEINNPLESLTNHRSLIRKECDPAPGSHCVRLPTHAGDLRIPGAAQPGHRKHRPQCCRSRAARL